MRERSSEYIYIYVCVRVRILVSQECLEAHGSLDDLEAEESLGLDMGPAVVNLVEWDNCHFDTASTEPAQAPCIVETSAALDTGTPMPHIHDENARLPGGNNTPLPDANGAVQAGAMSFAFGEDSQHLHHHQHPHHPGPLDEPSLDLNTKMIEEVIRYGTLDSSSPQEINEVDHECRTDGRAPSRDPAYQPNIAVPIDTSRSSFSRMVGGRCAHPQYIYVCMYVCVVSGIFVSFSLKLLDQSNQGESPHLFWYVRRV